MGCAVWANAWTMPILACHDSCGPCEMPWKSFGLYERWSVDRAKRRDHVDRTVCCMPMYLRTAGCAPQAGSSCRFSVAWAFCILDRIIGIFSTLSTSLFLSSPPNPSFTEMVGNFSVSPGWFQFYQALVGLRLWRGPCPWRPFTFSWFPFSDGMGRRVEYVSGLSGTWLLWPTSWLSSLLMAGDCIWLMMNVGILYNLSKLPGASKTIMVLEVHWFDHGIMQFSQT